MSSRLQKLVTHIINWLSLPNLKKGYALNIYVLTSLNTFQLKIFNYQEANKKGKPNKN